MDKTNFGFMGVEVMGHMLALNMEPKGFGSIRAES